MYNEGSERQIQYVSSVGVCVFLYGREKERKHVLVCFYFFIQLAHMKKLHQIKTNYVKNPE